MASEDDVSCPPIVLERVHGFISVNRCIWREMPSNYFGRVRGAIQSGFRRLVSEAKETSVQDHSDFSIGFRKLPVGNPTDTLINLSSLIHTDSVAAAGYHISNQRKNISVVGAFSRAISLPSISGPALQVCGFRSDPQRENMSLFGSTSTIRDYSLIAKCALPGYRSFRSNAGIGFECCPKNTMSLTNSEQRPNNFLIFGYFMYNAAKRKGYGKSFFGFCIKNLHSSLAAFSAAGIAHDVSFNNSVKDEDRANLSDYSEALNPVDRSLKLNSGSCYLPHPDKEETGGEDAHFICADEQAIGVADGVGGWADLGIDAGKYARELMSNSVNAIQDEPKGSVDPARVLEKAYNETRAKGSSTACIIALTTQGLHAINLGDSGFMVVRDGCTVFRSPAQQHDFNFTYQLESGNSGDLPSSGQVFTVPVAPGDVVIAGTDGLFDNLYNSDITAVVVHAQRAGFGPQIAAQKIVALARQRAQDKNRQTPFSTAAQEAGFRYYGGKLDDITVVVSYIASDEDRKDRKR